MFEEFQEGPWLASHDAERHQPPEQLIGAEFAQDHKYTKIKITWPKKCLQVTLYPDYKKLHKLQNLIGQNIAKFILGKGSGIKCYSK